jgi:tRNA(Glu) U13 pseudouridine synthase TruD
VQPEQPGETSVSPAEVTVRLRFGLPSGSYATVVVAALSG